MSEQTEQVERTEHTEQAEQTERAEQAEQRPWARPLLVVGALIVLTAVVAYWRAVRTDFARLDDFVYLYDVRSDNLVNHYLPFNLDMARPIPGALMTYVLPHVSSVDDLWILRLVALVVLSLCGVCLAALVLFTTRDQAGPARYVAAYALGLVPVATTAAPSSVTWAILVAGLHAFAAAFLAGMLVAWRSRWWWVASGALLLVTAFTYQQVVPVAMLPAMLVCATAFARRDPVPWVRTLLVGVMGVVSLGLNAIMLFSRGGVGSQRLVDAPLSERVDWFVHLFLPVTVDLSVPTTPGSTHTAIVVAVLLACLPLVHGWRHVALPLAVLVAYTGAVLAVFGLEMWASYRLASSAQVVLWGGVGFCVAWTVSRLRWRPVGVALALAGAATSLVALNVARNRAETYLAAPNARDWTAIQCLADEGVTTSTKIYTEDWAASGSPVVVGDEYGIAASSVAWSFEVALWMALDDLEPGLPTFQPGDLDILQREAVPDPSRELTPLEGCRPAPTR